MADKRAVADPASDDIVELFNGECSERRVNDRDRVQHKAVNTPVVRICDLSDASLDLCWLAHVALPEYNQGCLPMLMLDRVEVIHGRRPCGGEGVAACAACPCCATSDYDNLTCTIKLGSGAYTGHLGRFEWAVAASLEEQYRAPAAVLFICNNNCGGVDHTDGQRSTHECQR